MKFLHLEKEKLNNVVYKVHLKAAQEWRKGWYPIEKAINESINKELGRKYKIMYDKLRKLTKTQIEKLNNMTEFHTRVVNKTNTVFSSDELTLLIKGLK